MRAASIRLIKEHMYAVSLRQMKMESRNYPASTQDERKSRIPIISSPECDKKSR